MQGIQVARHLAALVSHPLTCLISRLATVSTALCAAAGFALADTKGPHAVRPSSRGSVTIDDRPNSRGGVQGSGTVDTGFDHSWPPAPQRMEGLHDRPTSASPSEATYAASQLPVLEQFGGFGSDAEFMPSQQPLSPIPPTPKEVAPSTADSLNSRLLAPEPEPELRHEPEPTTQERPLSATRSVGSAADESDEMPVDLRRVMASAKVKSGQLNQVVIPSLPGGVEILPSTGSTNGAASGSARQIRSKNWAVHGSLSAQSMATALQQSRQRLLAEKQLVDMAARRWRPDLNNLHPKHEQARAEAVRLFKTIDTDGNGFVTKKEMKAAMFARGVDMDQSQIDEMLRAGESDGDGMINCDEYVTMVLQAKRQREEREEAEGNAAVSRRMSKLKSREQKLAEHWDMLGSDVKTYGEEDDGMGTGLDGGGSFLGSLSPKKKKRDGRTKHAKQKATWQNSLGDFAAFPVVCLKSCCCPCVQFGLNGAEILEPECATCHADGNCCAHHIVPPHRHGDLCLPLGIGWMLLCPLVATIGGGCARFRLRRQLGIDGSAYQDCAVHVCCCCCAIIQEGAELEHERVRRQAEAREHTREQRLNMRGA